MAADFLEMSLLTAFNSELIFSSFFFADPRVLSMTSLILSSISSIFFSMTFISALELAYSFLDASSFSSNSLSFSGSGVESFTAFSASAMFFLMTSN